MNDTSPEVARIVHERLMALTGAERMEIGSQMFDVARSIVMASFPPDLSEIEIKRRLCERFYGDEVDVDAFIKHLQSIQSEKSDDK